MGALGEFPAGLRRPLKTGASSIGPRRFAKKKEMKPIGSLWIRLSNASCPAATGDPYMAFPLKSCNCRIRVIHHEFAFASRV